MYFVFISQKLVIGVQLYTTMLLVMMGRLLVGLQLCDSKWINKLRTK